MLGEEPSQANPFWNDLPIRWAPNSSKWSVMRLVNGELQLFHPYRWRFFLCERRGRIRIIKVEVGRCPERMYPLILVLIVGGLLFHSNIPQVVKKNSALKKDSHVPQRIG